MSDRQERIKRFRSNAEHQRKIGDLQGCLEFRALADDLEKLEKIEQIISNFDESSNYYLTLVQIAKVVQNEK